MNSNHFIKCVTLIILSLFLTSCTVPKTLIPFYSVISTMSQSEPISDDKNAYVLDEENNLIHLYVTVTRGNLFSETGETIGAVLQEGDESGPAEGYYAFDTNTENAQVQITGKPKHRLGEDSYRLVLSESAPLLNGNRVLNLQKNTSDITLLRTKLAFDYFRQIPNLVSARTQFVKLYIKEAVGSGFISCGLYTNVEELGISYLENHDLDPNGSLYKAVYFGFAQIKDVDGSQGEDGYDKNNFENILKICANNDKTRLFAMLGDLDDSKLSNNGVFERYFNRDNYLSWLAVNIMLGNLDANSRNIVLYSPPSSLSWYLLPWDDGTSFGYYGEGSSVNLLPWRNGVINYWNTTLHKRFLSEPKNVEKLSKKIEELRGIINPERTLSALQGYYDLVGQYIRRDRDEIQRQFEYISQETERNIDRYYRSLKLPVPSYTIGPVERDSQHLFTCEPSVCLDGGTVYYDFVLASDPQLQQVIEKIEDSVINEFVMNRLNPGVYYYKISFKNSAGDEQLSFDNYIDEQKIYYGVRRVEVK